MAKVGERSLLDHASAPQDPHPVAQRFDFTQDVRGQEDRLAPLLGLLHALAKDHLHQGVQAGCRLVEQEQIGPGGEGGDQLHLLAIPLGQRPDLLARVEGESLDQLFPVAGVDPAVQPGQELEGLCSGQGRPQERLPRDVGNPAMGGHRILPGVDPEQLSPTGGGAMEAEEEPNRRRLASSVRSQVPVHLPRGDGQIEGIERQRVAVAFGEAPGADGSCLHAGHGCHRSAFFRVGRFRVRVAGGRCWRWSNMAWAWPASSGFRRGWE